MAGISHVSILLYWSCKPITHAQSHPNRSLQRASVPPSTCHASITGTTRLFGWQRWLQLCAGLCFRQFLWCLLLEIGGTLYSSHVKGYKLSCSQLLYLAPLFLPTSVRRDQRSSCMILDHCYPYIYCDLGYQSNMHLITLAQVMANCCINPWWKIMRRLLRAWQLEHKPWINYRGVNLTSVGLKRLAWENLPPRWSFARYALQEQIKHASRNSTLGFFPTSLE